MPENSSKLDNQTTASTKTEHDSSLSNQKQASSNSKYLKQLLKPYNKKMMFALTLAIAAVLLFILQSALLAKLFANWLNALSTGGEINSSLLWQTMPWLGACLVARPLLNLIKEQYLLNTSLKIRQDVRKKLLKAVVALGPARQYYGSDGALSSKLLEQVEELDGYISHFYVQTYIAVITPLLIIICTFVYSPLAAVLLLTTAPLVPIFMILVGSAASEKSQAQFAAMMQLSGRFLDLLRGMPTLKRLNAGEFAMFSIKNASVAYQKRTMSVLKLAFLSSAVLELFASLAIALVALYLGLGLLGILPWAKGEIPVPYLGALFILLLAPEYYAPLRQLGSDYHAKAKAVAAVELFYPLLQTLNDKPQQKTSDFTLGAAAVALEFANLEIRSPDGRLRLANFNATIDAAERIGIFGASGAGKSSLLQALLGFAPFSGQLLLNGSSVNSSQLAAVRHQFAYLAQNSVLLPLSIKENLLLAKSTASEEELIAVLEQVELWDLIQRLPQGINSMLGERGKGLSGGQQQRLCIAQLLLQNANLWLLDEPCAHLDQETTAQIYRLLGNLSAGKTVLLVSHNLHDVSWVDKKLELQSNATTATVNEVENAK